MPEVKCEPFPTVFQAQRASLKEVYSFLSSYKKAFFAIVQVAATPIMIVLDTSIARGPAVVLASVTCRKD